VALFRETRYTFTRFVGFFSNKVFHLMKNMRNGEGTCKNEITSETNPKLMVKLL
jgi:hypothetical protein